jgi:D-lyxose ketol-isomerase
MDGKQISKAWQEWRDSPDGRKCLDDASLKLPPGQIDYLVNRLWHAFMAGAKAADTRPLKG